MTGQSIELVQEHLLLERDRLALVCLLDSCFPDTFEGRPYFKQLPHFRLLARDGDRLIGHVGVDHRVIRVDAGIFRIFGLIDLCVKSEMRGQGCGSSLLRYAEKIALKAKADFMVLMADRHELYLKHGYHNMRPAKAKWLAIEDRQSIMVMERDLGDCFMAKSLTAQSWPTGEIDMLGYLF